MGPLWNQDTGSSGNGSTGETSQDRQVGTVTVDAYIEAEETVEGVVRGDGTGLTRQMDDWESTEVPGPDETSVVVVTDREVLIVVVACRDPSVDGDYVRRVPHEEVSAVQVEESLLSTQFTVETVEGVRLSLTPAHSEGLTDVADFVRRASKRWRAATPLFEGLETRLADLERALRDGDHTTAGEIRTDILADISEARTSSSLHEITLGTLERRIDAAEERVQLSRARGHTLRASHIVSDVGHPSDVDNTLRAVEQLREACAEYLKLGKVLAPDLDFGAVDVDGNETGSVLLDRLAAYCVAVDSLEETETSVQCWRGLYDCYSDLHTALCRTPDILPCAVASIEFHLDWFAHCFVDTLQERADSLEHRGDTALENGQTESAREAYKDAIALLQEGQTLDPPNLTTSNLGATTVETLEQKIEQTVWQWGGSG